MLEHGGNLAWAVQKYGIPLAQWLDLSTGINPNGYPIPIIPATAWQRLPLEDDGLIEAATAYYGARFALPTTGSQTALQVLPRLRAPSKVAMLSPMYKEHALAWQSCGHHISTFADVPDEATLTTADVIVLCNPNNPTAKLFSSADLLQWHAQLSKRGGWLVIDEAFMDTTPEFSLAQYAHLEGLFILRSVGKFFGLAGARVGFLLAVPQALAQIQELLGPWPLTGASRFIAQLALKDLEWQQQTRQQLLASSQRLAMLLGEYGLTPTAQTALYQWVPTGQAAAWHTHFAKQGIWVRKFDQIAALRFGLPTDDGWEKLEQSLQSGQKLWI